MKLKRRAASLLLTACLVAGLMPTGMLTAYAADTGKAIQLVTESSPTGGISGYDGTDNDYIYYGYWTAPDNNTTSGAIKWRVLDTKTNMDNAVEGDGLFVLSEELLGSRGGGNVIFWNSGAPLVFAHNWQGSGAQAWCKDFAGIDGSSVKDAFSSAELAAILETTKTDGNYGRSQYSYNILNGDKVFFLSAEEADNSAVYGFSRNEERTAKYGSTSADWWLRSPGEGSAQKTGYVANNGEVTWTDIDENLAKPARPAFNLDLSAVLFTSAADNSGHNGSFSEPATYSGSEWKLTLADGNDFASGASVTDGKTSLIAGYSAETLTVSHASLSSLSSDYTNVTAMLTDSDGAVVYYGSINNDTSAKNSTVTIPAGLAAGTYTLSVYGEDWNAANMTDYATGTPFTTQINVISYTLNVTAPTFDEVTYGYTQPDAKAVTITSSGNSDSTITSVSLSGTDAGSFRLNKTDGATITAQSTDSSTYTVQPEEGLSAGTYTATIVVTYNDGATAEAEVSFTVNEAALSYYTITATAGEGGSITLTAADMSQGGYAVYEITPDNGYEIDVVMVDGADATDRLSAGQYTFDDIQGNHTISVTFRLAGTAGSGEDGSGTGTGTTDSGEDGSGTGTGTTDPADGTTTTTNRTSSSDDDDDSSSSSFASDDSGTWVQDGNGWRYVYKDGRYEAGTAVAGGDSAGQVSWKQIDGKWWAFGADGYLATGWVFDQESGLWYYVDETTGRKTGWHYDNEDGRWYYLDPVSGHMLTGWQWIDGKWYYFNGSSASPTWVFDGDLNKWIYDESTSHRPFGAMYADEETPDGHMVGKDGSREEAVDNGQQEGGR
ncbi:MAG: DUF6273 domain-containing protein [Clostridiales bacterium]|nr:DUF6273 domain-containing protein [Clostridiales bacterium]